MNDVLFYEWFRMLFGMLGVALWLIVLIRTYVHLSEHNDFNSANDFDSRLSQIVLAALPLVYSAGYTFIFAYSLAYSEPKLPDIPVVVTAVAVQAIFNFAAIVLLLGLRRDA